MATATDTMAGALPNLFFTRVFDAPRELVFKMWTDPYHGVQWWQSPGCTIPVAKLDARPGGSFEIRRVYEDGTVFVSVGEFREVVAPERIVFLSVLEDDRGEKLIDAANAVGFEDVNGKTRMTLHVEVQWASPKVTDLLDSMERRWSESLGRFEEEIVRTGRKR